jgi:hypothetical protein
MQIVRYPGLDTAVERLWLSHILCAMGGKKNLLLSDSVWGTSFAEDRVFINEKKCGSYEIQEDGERKAEHWAYNAEKRNQVAAVW